MVVVQGLRGVQVAQIGQIVALLAQGKSYAYMSFLKNGSVLSRETQTGPQIRQIHARILRAAQIRWNSP
jgi:hypothetical protein